MADIKDRILSLRVEKELTQEKMAKIFNVGLSTVSMWERGERIPRPKILQEICDYFNIDMDYLMGRSDIKNKYQAGLKYDWEDKLKQKIINKDSKVELKGDFTITENIEGEYIRILSVFNDRTADERIYDLKTNKYNEKKINKIIISFNIDNEDYTAEDTNKFIKLFSEYKKLSDDKQKEIDSIIYGKEKRNNYIDYINFSESFDKDTFLDIKNYYKIPTTTETKKSLIKSNCIISTFYTLDLNTTKNIKSTVLEKDSDSKNVLSDKIYIPKVSLKNNESNTKK